MRVWIVLLACGAAAVGQERSVKPGINDAFLKNLDLPKYLATFEGESREIYAHRAAIADACGLRPGMVVADIGAGTGLFTRLFAARVGPEGQVFAVDIAPKFLEHIRQTARAAGHRNVTPVLCSEDSVDLPPNSIDVAYVCDTYHHFEFPARTLDSLRRALKPDGRLIVVDFHRIPGKTKEWTMNHVRAGKEVVEAEIVAAGFAKLPAPELPLEENYFVVFGKRPNGP